MAACLGGDHLLSSFVISGPTLVFHLKPYRQIISDWKLKHWFQFKSYHPFKLPSRDNLLANCAKLHFITILNSYLFLLNNWKDKKTNQSDAFVDVFLDSKISNAVNVCPKTITVTNVEKMNCRFLWICKLPCITSPETKLHISGKINNWFAIRSCIWLCTSVRTAHDVITSHHLHYG